ncbi:MAG: glycosyltransferase, partial [Planctomycetaceae bacterium]|nr:glycosyltransferase [Planctomycetaceae bacterium]
HDCGQNRRRDPTGDDVNPLSSPQLTILIPLHRAGPWVWNITQNLQRFPEDCRVLISDATLKDEAVNWLEERHAGDSRVQFFRKASDIDWRVHINELLERVDTEFASILPQDDAIHAGYYEALMAALDANPSAGLAFGVIDAIHPLSQVPERLPSPPFPLGESPPYVEAIRLDRTWNLGAPWRGVVRRDLLWPTPLIPHDFADQIWTFGIALRAHLVEVPSAIYLKRYHANCTHLGWKPLNGETREQILRETIEHHFADNPDWEHSALEFLRQSKCFA